MAWRKTNPPLDCLLIYSVSVADRSCSQMMARRCFDRPVQAKVCYACCPNCFSFPESAVKLQFGEKEFIFCHMSCTLVCGENFNSLKVELILLTQLWFLLLFWGCRMLNKGMTQFLSNNIINNTIITLHHNLYIIFHLLSLFMFYLHSALQKKTLHQRALIWLSWTCFFVSIPPSHWLNSTLLKVLYSAVKF